MKQLDKMQPADGKLQHDWKQEEVELKKYTVHLCVVPLTNFLANFFES